MLKIEILFIKFIKDLIKYLLGHFKGKLTKTNIKIFIFKDREFKINIL